MQQAGYSAGQVAKGSSPPSPAQDLGEIHGNCFVDEDALRAPVFLLEYLQQPQQPGDADLGAVGAQAAPEVEGARAGGVLPPEALPDQAAAAGGEGMVSLCSKRKKGGGGAGAGGSWVGGRGRGGQQG